MEEFDERADMIEAIGCGLLLLAGVPVGAILCALLA